jgi:hypothetical protein
LYILNLLKKKIYWKIKKADLSEKECEECYLSTFCIFHRFHFFLSFEASFLVSFGGSFFFASLGGAFLTGPFASSFLVGVLE